jgi:hypothetical protein
VVINALIVAILFGVVIANLVSLDVLRGHVAMRLNEATRVVGLHQGWTMFAPPPEASPRLVVGLQQEDGTVREWERPGGRLGNARAYHWGKLEEAMVVRRNTVLLASFADWVERQERGTGRTRVTAVRLQERWQLLNPPGPGPSVAHEHVNVIVPNAPGNRPADAGRTI